MSEVVVVMQQERNAVVLQIVLKVLIVAGRRVVIAKISIVGIITRKQLVQIILH